MMNANMSGAGAINDPLGFVKNLWAGMGIPGMVAPTVSSDELAQKISDLKVVESWLNLNMNMLRGTIQALEVQRATILTLQSMGEAFSSAAKTATEEKPAFDAAAFWSALSAAASQSTQTATPEPENAADSKAASDAAAAKQPEAAEATPPLVNPVAWWNTVQEQFKHAVSTAIAADTADASADQPPSSDAAPKAASAKPAAAARKRKSPPKK